MPKRLIDNLSSLYVGAGNSLRPKAARKKIVAYVESYDDILFWRNILDAFENDKYFFEVMLPSRENLNRGKKPAMMNVLRKALGECVIACVDADYDYLLQGATETSREVCENPYIFHTYAYAIENYQCNARDLHDVCVMATLNDHRVVDFVAFFELYSKIVYPLFAWSVYFYRKNDLHTFSLLDFSNVTKLTVISVPNPGKALERLEEKVNRQLQYFESAYPEKVEEVEDLKGSLRSLGVYPENTYYFVQGHHIFENVTMHVVAPVCQFLRNEREKEIRSLAAHEMQYKNEYSSYTHSQCSVELMLKKNRAILDCEPFERLKKDLKRFISKMS